MGNTKDLHGKRSNLSSTGASATFTFPLMQFAFPIKFCITFVFERLFEQWLHFTATLPESYRV